MLNFAAHCTKQEVVVQVLVRFQWVMEVMRGQSTHMEVSLEGLATSVMGGLQDELFNLTLDNLQVSPTSQPTLAMLIFADLHLCQFMHFAAVTNSEHADHCILSCTFFIWRSSDQV